MERQFYIGDRLHYATVIQRPGNFIIILNYLILNVVFGNTSHTVIIQPQEECLSLKEIMSEISSNAKARGMTPDILENILGGKIRHIL